MNKQRLEKIKHSYEENGFVIIRKLLGKSEIQLAKIELQDEVKKLIKGNKLRNRDINFSKNQINSIHKLDHWSWTKKLQKNNRLIKVIKKLLGNNVDNFGAELFAKPPKVGLPAPIHQDNYFWCLKKDTALTVWIALDKADENNGGIFYYKGSHKLGILEHIPSYAPGTSQKIKYIEGMNLFRLYSPSLSPGDCIIHNCLIVHGSKKNLSNKPRVGWTLRFKSKNNKIDESRKKQYEKELKSQIKLRKKSARI